MSYFVHFIPSKTYFEKIISQVEMYIFWPRKKYFHDGGKFEGTPVLFLIVGTALP